MNKCSECTIYACYYKERVKEISKLSFCPMNNSKKALGEASAEYEKPWVKKIAHAASWVEGVGYMEWTRIEETIEFAKKLKYKKIGIACCLGFEREGKTLVKILEANGFEVVFIFCKTGGIPKERLGIENGEKK